MGFLALLSTRCIFWLFCMHTRPWVVASQAFVAPKTGSIRSNSNQNIHWPLIHMGRTTRERTASRLFLSNLNKNRLESNTTSEFHLLSLQFTPLDSSSSRYSKATADIWRWKDAVLGDGRDYFINRPQTLVKLSETLVQRVPGVEECIVLSNCARFEVLLLVPNNQHNLSHNKSELSLHVSRALTTQANYFQTNVNAASKLMVNSMDWPSVIASTTTVPQAISPKVDRLAQELQSHWTHSTNETEILQHLARVACGMALRPRRPRRPVVFRSFSSRDAHVLLQLKRTVDAFGPHSKRLVSMLQFALQAGKAARNVQQVSELEQLQPYGSGDTSKYSSQPPSELMERVMQAVTDKVIEPMVKEFLADLVANQQANVISEFRKQCQILAETDHERQWILREMHEPTLRLRQGEPGLHVSELVSDMKERLHAKRQANVETREMSSSESSLEQSTIATRM